MTLPDFMDYKDKFTQRAFVEKISHVAKRAGAKMVYTALILYYTLESDKVSLKDKALIVGALGYLISPLDVIPDAIPIAGLGDDLAVLLFVLKKVWGEVSDMLLCCVHTRHKNVCHLSSPKVTLGLKHSTLRSSPKAIGRAALNLRYT